MRSQNIKDAAIALLAENCHTDAQIVAEAIRLIEAGQAYREIKIKKKSGKDRILHAPCAEVKAVQAGLLEFLYRWPADESMYGSVPGKRLRGNAARHCMIMDNRFEGRIYDIRLPRWTLSLDLKDAFPSVKAKLLRRLFTEMITEYGVIDYHGLTSGEADPIEAKIIDLLLLLTSHKGRLPQGAPTSPHLLNLALKMTGTVERIKEVCETREEMAFTIYVDDITVSSMKRKISDRFIGELIAAIELDGIFRVNREKTRRNSEKYKAHKITGLSITAGWKGIPRITLPQEDQNRLRGQIHRARLYLEQTDPLDVRQAEIDPVLGQLAWIKSVYGEKRLPSRIKKEYWLFKRHFRRFQKLRRLERFAQLEELREFLRRFAELLRQTRTVT